MIFDVFINEKFWKTFDFPRAIRTPIGRIMVAVRSARDAGELDEYMSPDGVLSIRIEPQKII